MSTVLTSWKEIAAYLGKGVRTVQRWEQELALPVRRPKSARKQVIIAVPQEIDEWVRAQTTEHPTIQAEVESLHARIKALETENQQLRQQLQAFSIGGRPTILDDVREPLRGSRVISMEAEVSRFRQPREHLRLSDELLDNSPKLRQQGGSNGSGERQRSRVRQA